MSATDFLGAEGPLSRVVPGYQVRGGQLQMAAAVERVLKEDRLLLCEAGTGTGKTLAYLVPALLSGRRVIVSTATRALQEQIVRHDLPLLERALGRSVDVAVMKGLGNYVCRRRLSELQRSPAALEPKTARSLAIVEAWTKESETGDMAELSGLSEYDPIWPQVTSSSDTRIGPKCAHYETCFITRMRRSGERAELVIVNHHLFFADLALRGPHPASVLPDYDAVIFDEAHQLEDVAGLFFGIRISPARGERLLGDLKRALLESGEHGMLPRSVGLLEQGLAAFWSEVERAVPAHEPRVTLAPDDFVGPLQQTLFALDSALEAGLSLLEDLTNAPRAGEAPQRGVRLEVLELLGRRVETLREQLNNLAEGGSGRVTWVDKKPLALSSTLVDLSFVLRERLFERVPAVVLTSATLTTLGRTSSDAGRAFDYIRRRLGLDASLDVTELSVASPFDFENRALLYVPKDLPPPRTPQFLSAAAERIAALIETTKGGAFVLTTSLKSMRELYELLKLRLAGYPLMLQGQSPKHALISAFRARSDAVLVATQSFWEGVDVPGAALRLVVLEKLPFLVPTDPIVKARALAIERDGGSSFMDLFVPQAAISLKQGFGRLIRTEADVGVVALLDERVHKKGYGARLLSALPPAARTSAWEDVEAFAVRSQIGTRAGKPDAAGVR